MAQTRIPLKQLDSTLLSTASSIPLTQLTTSITGVLKGNGTGVVAATAGTDYSAGTSSLATGILKSTTSTGALSIAVAGDFPTLNQNTTGSAAKWTTARNLAGNSVDGSANVAFANKFIVQGTTDGGLSGAQFLGALSTGLLKNTTTTGVLSTATAGIDYSAGTSALATGILKTTTTTGALTIAVAADFPTLNQNTTGSAATLTTPRNINGVAFDGSGNITVTAAAGTLTGTTLNSSVTTASIGTLANLTTNGFVKTSGGTGALSVDTSTYITGNQTITLSGDASGSGTTAITVTLPTVNSNVGTFNNITINAKGQATAGSNVAYITASSTDTLTNKTYNGNTITPQYGGTGLTSLPFALPGRLTLTTGVPITTSDVTAATTVYYTPFTQAVIALYDGTRWNLRAFSEISVAVPSTLFRPFDVFCYDNAGTPTLETVNWNQSTGSITAATNATPVVITSVAHGLSNGDLVGVAGMSGNTAPNSYVWTVANVTANTFELQGSVGNGTYTTGGTWYKSTNTRATAIALQNGIETKSGDATRRYLGTLCTTSVSGQTEDSLLNRLCWNRFNQSPRKLKVNTASFGYTYSTAAYRMTNAAKVNQVNVVIGQAGGSIQLSAYSLTLSTVDTSTNGVYTGIGYDNILSDISDAKFVGANPVVTGNSNNNISSAAVHYPAIGLHYYPWLEKGHGTGTQTWYPQNGGFIGVHFC